MPLLLTNAQIEPGMCLAEPFRFNGRLMLPANRALTASEVNVLRRQYRGLEVRVTDPALDKVADFEDDAYERQVARDVHGAIRPIIESLVYLVVQRKHKSLSSSDLSQTSELVRQQLQYLNNNPVSAALIGHCPNGDRYLPFHTANVFYLSLVLASTVQEYVANERLRHTSSRQVNRSTAMDLLPLGMGIVCMDLGMIRLEHLSNKQEPLTEEERRHLRAHPTDAANLLPDTFSPTARMIVRTHHENYDGTGYPVGLAGDKLHVFTRIVRIADAFDAAISPCGGRTALSPARALWEMAYGLYSRYYDPLLMKVFFSLIQPFPIGARLQLIDGRDAIVVGYNRANPFEPRAIVAFDSQGHRLPPDQLEPPVELSAANGLGIASFRGEDLSFLRDAGPDVDSNQDNQPPRSLEFQSFFETVYP